MNLISDKYIINVEMKKRRVSWKRDNFENDNIIATATSFEMFMLGQIIRPNQQISLLNDNNIRATTYVVSCQ